MNGKNKKVIAGALALSMALPATAYAGISHIMAEKAVVSVAAAPYSIGDMDGDGSVTLTDAQEVLKMALKIKEGTEQQKKAADADRNGKVDLADAQLVLKWALKISQVPTESEEPQQTAEPDVSKEPAASAEPSTPAASTEPSAPAVSQMPSGAPIQSRVPIVPPSFTPKPKPTKTPVPVGASLEPVAPADYVVTGQSVAMVASNGAIETDGIYTFTDDNKKNEKGIQFEWPFSGRKDLRETLEDAGVKLADIAAIPKANLEKGNWEKNPELANYNYPRPTWHNGISISFWSKQKWLYAGQSNPNPILMIKRTKFCDDNAGSGDTGYGDVKNAHGKKDNCDFAFSVRASGCVTMEAGDDASNGFRADNLVADKNDVWTHFTVTIANDWVTVYINGQELAYYSVDLDNGLSSKYFNDGFMTRYNPTGLVTKDLLNKDVRKYLLAKGSGNGNHAAWRLPDGKEDIEANYESNWEASIIGNGRYKVGTDGAADSSGKMLLMDLLTQDGVELYLGGLRTCCLRDGRTLECKYETPSGSQVAGLQCYESELKADEVAAIYEDAAKKFPLEENDQP